MSFPSRKTLAEVPLMATAWRPAPLRYRFAEYEFREQTGELCRKGRCVRLPDQASRILQTLLSASGQMVTREQLKLALWPGKVFGDFEGGLNAAVRKLRRSLEDDGSEPRLIGTLPKRGYRLLVPVEIVEEGAPAASIPAEAPDPGPVVPHPRPRRRSWWSRLWVAFSSSLRPLHSARWQRRAKLSDIRSLALLPLENPGADASQDYLAASLTEQLIQELALRRDLQVASLAAVRSLERERMHPPELCRRLGVGAIVEGSVLLEGDQLLLNLRLMPAHSGLAAWAHSVRMPWKELSEIPARAVSCLAGVLSLPASPARRFSEPRDAETMALYMEARHELSRLTLGGIDKAIGLYERVALKDPRFAAVYAGLATAELWRGILSKRGAAVSLIASYRHALHALELDPGSGDAHLALAFIHWLHDWDFQAAEGSFGKALEASPGSIQVRAAYASYLMARGRTAEAEEHLAHAEPYVQGDPMVAIDVLRCLTFARRHQDTVKVGQAILASRPHWTWAYGHIFEACLACGLDKEAIDANLNAVAEEPSLAMHLEMPRRYGDLRAMLRREVEWNETRQEQGEPCEGPGVVAYLWAALGERDKALDWLEAALKVKDYDALFVLRYPYWDAFHGDPRFERALVRMGLQDDPRAPLLAKAGMSA